MKKFLAIITMTAMLCTLAACGNNEDPANTESKPIEEQSQEAETQPDPLAPTEEAEQPEETEPEAETEAPETEEVTEDEGQPDPLDSSAFSLDENGALIFTEDAAAESDRTLIAAAQSLFESACRTEFTFTVGCAYPIDSDEYISNEFDWKYYLVTVPGINSIDDVLADYHTVFSSAHDDTFVREMYTEADGKVYELPGGRGADIYYSGSKVTQVESRGDNEITFSVENYYDGTDWGESAYTEYDTFSMVFEDGAWRADQFNMPY